MVPNDDIVNIPDLYPPTFVPSKTTRRSTSTSVQVPGARTFPPSCLSLLTQHPRCLLGDYCTHLDNIKLRDFFTESDRDPHRHGVQIFTLSASPYRPHLRWPPAKPLRRHHWSCPCPFDHVLTRCWRSHCVLLVPVQTARQLCGADTFEPHGAIARHDGRPCPHCHVVGPHYLLPCWPSRGALAPYVLSSSHRRPQLGLVPFIRCLALFLPCHHGAMFPHCNRVFLPSLALGRRAASPPLPTAVGGAEASDARWAGPPIAYT